MTISPLTAEDPQRWVEQKKQLAAEFSFLSPFIPTVEQATITRIEQLIKTGGIDQFEYEPLLVEQHLTDTANLLDRCLAYRREARELEIEAVRFAIEYKKNQELLDKDSEIDRATSERLLRDQEAAELREASKTFGTSNDLGVGFSREMLVRANAAAAKSELCRIGTELHEARRNILRHWEAVYRARHHAPGSAHNYEERMARTVEFLSEDLFEAYQKSRALFDGIQRIYDHKFPLPALEEGLVDHLVKVVRRASRYLDYHSQREIPYDIVVPLCQPWGPYPQGLIDVDEFRNYLQKPEGQALEFDLHSFAFGQSHVRLKSVGLSFGNVSDVVTENWSSTGENGNQTTTTGTSYSMAARVAKFRLRATIHTPEQAGIDGKPYRRPPVILGNVSVFGGSSTACESGPNCTNILPFGRWRIFLEPHVVWAGWKEAKIAPTENPNEPKAKYEFVDDLKLHLRVVSTFESESSAFSG